MNHQEGIAVISGAGRGLGRALARLLVARGVTVAGIGRCDDGLAETEGLCRDSDMFHAFDCDISRNGDLRETFAAIRRIAPVSIMINNAAVYPRQDFLDETPESFMETVAINLGGMAACSHHALQDMVACGSGRIVNVTSFADLAPLPASSAYSVSKGAGRILTRALVADICDRFPGIVINDWLPGILATRMGMPDGLDPDEAARWGAELALWNDPSLSGTVWERDTEILPPRSLKRRVLDRLLMRRPPQPRRLAGLDPLPA